MFRAAGLKCFSVLPVSLYTPAVFSLWTLDILQTPNRQCENQLHSSLSGESMCSNGIPIHLQLIALVPIPSGGDRFAGNVLFEFDFHSTEDVDPEAHCWLDLPPGKFDCCWFFFFSPPQVIDVALLSKLSGLLCLFNSVSVRRLSCSHSVLFKWEDVSGLLVCAPTVVISWDELHAFHSTKG